MPSDNFAGTPGTALGTYSSSWTVNANAADIVINSGATGVVSAVSALSPYNNAIAFWNASSANADQFAQATLTFVGGSATQEAFGVCVRCNSSGNGYVGIYLPQNNSAYIALFANFGSGVFINGTIANDGIAWASGDVMRLEIIGTALQLKRNGTVTCSASDGTYSTGQYGVSFYSGVSIVGTVGTWSAGNLPEGPTADQLVPIFLQESVTAMIGRRVV